MDNRKPVVSNAANTEQLSEAEQVIKLARDNELNDIRSILMNKEGRRVFWRLLGHCNNFKSCFDPSGSRVYYNVGKQDVGHFIMAEILEANQDAYFLMMTEARKAQAEQDARELAASEKEQENQ